MTATPSPPPVAAGAELDRASRDRAVSWVADVTAAAWLLVWEIDLAGAEGGRITADLRRCQAALAVALAAGRAGDGGGVSPAMGGGPGPAPTG